MRKRNLTPFLFAPLPTSRKPPKPEVSYVVRGRFSLAPGKLVAAEDQGRLAGELFEDDDADALGGCLRPADLVDVKLHGELLLTGLCYAPGHKPTRETFIRLAISKAAGAGSAQPLVGIDRRVFGPRVWTESLTGKPYSAPLAFTTMKLGWAQSFGGPGHPANPVGKGIAGHELPNVEWADSIGHRGDRPRPACPGPVSRFWPERSSKLGRSYGSDYQKQRAPYYAEDFDWSYFQAAPEGQQIKGYFRGDELLSCVNLHPNHPNLDCQLPGIRPRLFVRDFKDRFREVPLVLDTVHVDSALGVVELAWRGIDAVMEQDGSDIDYAIIASEPLEGKALPVSHYQAMMGDFVADPLGIREAIPQHLRPHLDRAQALAAASSEEQPKVAGMAGVQAEVDRACRALPPEEAEALRSAVQAMLAAAKELHEAAVQRAVQAEKPPPAALDALVDAAVAAKQDGAKGTKPALDLDPQGKPRLTLGELVGAQRRVLAEAEQQADLPEEAKKRLKEFDKPLADPELERLDPALVGGDPLAALEPGSDLRYRMLADRDLRGIDLRGCDLRGAILRGTDLSGALLSEAIFDKALLADAKLDQADLSGAKLDGGLFVGASLRGANLSSCTLDLAVFSNACLDQAKLDGSRGMLVQFQGASLVGATARKVIWFQSNLSQCKLDGADFREASLLRCHFGNCVACGAQFEGAKVGHISFEQADLTDAKFGGASGAVPSFMGAELTRAEFSGAVLPGAHFSGAKGEGVRFSSANLPEARFSKARLIGAAFQGANLMAANFNDAEVSRSSFVGANLFDARLVRTSGKGCDFMNANLKRSTLEGV